MGKVKKIYPYLYILPAFIIILVFRLIPITLSFIISFFEWSVGGAGDFIGLNNYFAILHDREFWKSMLNTFYLVIGIVPITLILSMIFATMLNGIEKLRGFFRTVYYIPSVTSMVAISIVWKIIFNQQSGLANYFLKKIGLNPLGWLAESRGIFELFFGQFGIDVPFFLAGPSLALFSIILVSIWRSLGYNTILYLAGMQNIPNVYYEAAEIDGASKIKQFFKVTVPLISPTTYYVLMMTTITTFQVFSQVYLMTGPPIGGPLGTTKVIVYYIYEKGFGESNNLSYASAVALILFVIILSLTLVQKKIEKRVHY
ncbi:MAG: sugar ABC transporter permease [Candidatus Cloacimonadota bacterium]|nr:MAG: sugar ABC transporter permease [Candidatus Cloacimonadota bacterium]